MSNPILVVSSHPNFGSLIQKSIEVAGDWKVFRAQTGKEAALLGKSQAFSLAILDSGVRDIPLQALISTLRGSNGETKIALIIPGKDPRRSAGAPADAFLTMPFQSADLLDLLDLVREQKTKNEEAEVKVDPQENSTETPDSQSDSWMEDASRSAQYLTRLTLESGAQAALILKDGKLWAYAGSLLEAAANELARAVARDWISNGGIDMARFVHLPFNNVEYMVYATNLTDQKVLAVVYNAETPFSKIRSETGKLAKALVAPPQYEQVQVDQRPVNPSEWSLEYQGDAPQEPNERLEQALASLPPLFDEDVPPPSVQSIPVDGKADMQKDLPIEPLPELLPEQASSFTIPDHPVSRIESIPGFEAVGPGEPVPIPSQSRGADPARSANTAQKPNSQLPESTSTGFSDLVLSCILIPRLPKHRLVGDLAASLQRWLSEICLAYGWRLEGLQLQTDALIWVAKTNPSTSPIRHIRTVRQLTSKYIFDDFPRIGRDNPSGDFWAPGYLITSNSRLPTIQVVQAFIHQIRQRQGISDK